MKNRGLGKILARIGFVLVGSVLLVLGILLILPSKWLGARLVEWADDALTKNQISIKCSDPAASPLSLSFEASRCSLRRGLIVIEIDNPIITLAQISPPRIELVGTTYGSRCSLSLTPQEGRLQPCTLQLNAVPHVSVFGVTGGQIIASATVNFAPELSLDATRLPPVSVLSTISVRLNKVSHPQPTPLPPFLRALIRDPLLRGAFREIPALGELSADLSIRDMRALGRHSPESRAGEAHGKSHTASTEITLASLASEQVVSGRGTLQIRYPESSRSPLNSSSAASRRASISGNGRFELSQSGLQKLGPFLTILAPPSPEQSSQTRFDWEVSGSLDDPRWSLSASE